METKGSNDIDFEKEKNKNDFEKERRNLIDKYEKEIKKLMTKIEENEEIERKIENKYKILFNENDKEKQILINENKNLLSEIEILKKRQNDLKIQNEKEIIERNETLKKIKENYEKEIKEFTAKIENLSSKTIDLESSLKSYEQLIEFAKIDKEELEIKLKEEKTIFSEKIENLKKKNESDKKKYISQIDAKNLEIQKLESKLQKVQDESLIFLKNSEEKMNQKASEYQNLYYQEKQKNSFYEEKIKDLNEQIAQMKTNNEKIVEYIQSNHKTLNQDSESDENFINKITNLHQIFITEKKNIEQNFDVQKEYFIKETENKTFSINLLQQEIRTLEMKLQLTEKDLEKVKNLNKNLENEIKNTEIIRNNFNEELLKKNQISQKIFEEKLSEKEKEHQQEIEEINFNSEKTVKQLKNLFEEEKKRLESKIESLKTEYKQSILQITNEYEEKIKEIDKNIKNDYELLQISYDDLKAKYNTLTLDAEHNITLLSNEVLTSEQIISQNKENLIKITKAHNEDIQIKLKQFSIERKELNDKIDTLVSSNVEKDKDITNLKNQIEKQESTIISKNKEIKDIKDEYENTIENIVKKFELYKSKQQEIANDFNIKKMDFIRETSLLKQQIDFLNKKIENQAAFSEENEQQHDENIYELKKELEDTFNYKMNELNNEKKEYIIRIKEYENLIQNYDSKLDEVTTYYEDKINQEKYNQEILNDKLRKQIKNLKNENDKLSKEISEPIQKINQLLELQTSLQKENSDMKDYIFDLENFQKDYLKKIEKLQKENQDLLIKNENLNTSVYQLRMHLKIKNQNSSIELRKRHNSLFSKQSPLMSISVSNLDNKMNNSEICNLSVADSVFYSDLNGSGVGYVRKKIKNSTNRSLPSLIKSEERKYTKRSQNNK